MSGEDYPAEDENGNPELDPELAFLDPGLYTRTAASTGPYVARGTFDRRTGRFAGGGGGDLSSSAAAAAASSFAGDDPATRHSTTAKARRQMSAYFDVDEWEQQKAQEHEKRQAEAQQGGGSRKRGPTKAELQRFKEQKRERKRAKLGWLKE